MRVDVHEVSGDGAPDKGNFRAYPTACGTGVESLYRVVFVDRLQALQRRGVVHLDDAAPGADAGHSVAIEIDRPFDGQLPNLRLVLRWRDA